MIKILSIFGCMLSVLSFGNPVRSNVGGSHILHGAKEDEQKFTVSDYVQDGLVAVWDGIENAGWGVHDKQATEWRELINGTYTVLGGKGYFDGNAMCIPLRSQIPLVSVQFDNLTERTIEYCFGDFGDSLNIGWNFVYLEDNRNNSSFSMQVNVARKWRVTSNVAGVQTQDISIDEIGASEPIDMMTYSFSQGITSKTYVNGVFSKELVTRPFTSFTSIGLGLRTGMSQKAYCIRVYNRVLSDEEIVFNHEIDLERFGN